MIDYEIVLSVDGRDVDVSREDVLLGANLGSYELVSQETGLSDDAVIELLRGSSSLAQLNERLSNLDNISLSDTEISNLERDLSEVADNADSVHVYENYGDWLESQDYIVGELRRAMPSIAEYIIDAIDAEQLFDSGDTSMFQVMPSGKIVEFGYE